MKTPKYPKYRLHLFDATRGFYFLERKVFWFIYRNLEFGTLEEVTEAQKVWEAQE